MNRYTVRLIVECEMEAYNPGEALSKCQTVEIRGNNQGYSYDQAPKNTRIVAGSVREWVKPPEETER